jgi:dihydrofolate reductase
MRKLTASLFISLDGVVDEPQNWHFPYFNDEMGAAVDALINRADTALYGRKTYEGFAEAWSAREDAGGDDAELAKKFGDQRKLVVSNQEPALTWRNSELLEGDFAEGVKALKAEEGGDISISGSVSIIRQALLAGLLDELHLLVHPIAVRSGLRLFDEGDDRIPLKLLSSQTFKTGVLYVVYAPDEAPPEGGYEEAVQAHAEGTAEK